MTEREDFHLPGQHEQQDHAGGSGSGDKSAKYVPPTAPKSVQDWEMYGGNAPAGVLKRANDLQRESAFKFDHSEALRKWLEDVNNGSYDGDQKLLDQSYALMNKLAKEANDMAQAATDALKGYNVRQRKVTWDSEGGKRVGWFTRDNFAKLEGAEIFASGKWNGLDFSDEDLDKIVQSFEFFELGGRVPLKLGHNDEQPLTDGQPALGWVSRIWREGSKLKADFTDMPTAIYDLIKRGAYKFVSVELLRDVIAGTRTVPLVLDAVALLGADLPAVGTLKDLQALTMSRQLEGRERLTFTQAFINSGDVKTMADEDTKVAMEELRRELAEAKARAAQNEERFTKLDTETKAAKVAAHRKSIVDMLEDAVRSKKIQPSVRERFMRRFKIETDDAGVMLIPLSDVESYIRENPNPFLKNLNVTNGGDPDEIPAGGLPDRELMARARKLCRDRGKNPENWEDLKAAGVAIMKSDPQLAERYRSLPDDHADGKYSM